jgi:bifunctional UDP-N-acetylglucosamine pyrophosphorylase/glucosamine-1-phosphate N-acetyltransferase
MLKENGFNDVLIVGRDNNLERLDQMAEDASMNIEVVEQDDLSGMCGAILAAKEKIGDEPILIFSSNDVVDGAAFKLIKEAYDDGGAESYILGKKMEEYFPGGYLETDSSGFISNIVEKPGEGNEPSNLVNLVVHLHSNTAKLVEHLEKAESESDDLYEVALAAMMQDGVKMKAVSYDDFWQPIKFPWHIQPVFKYFFDKSKKFVSDSAEISDKAIVKGEVIIGKNVKIFEGAVINGPVYLGDGCVVANNSLVRESHLGEGCVVGYSTEVARSYLGHDVWTHSNYIGDSVIGNNVSFGAGTVTGNLRLDEKNICVDCDGDKVDTKINKFGLFTGDNIRVGVNTSFMPGIKLGSDSFVGAGLVIAQNIPEKSFVRGSFELKISENKSSDDNSNRSEMKNKLN